MTASAHARADADRAVHSRSLTLLARAGFIGYGLLHALVAWLTVQIAVGRSATEGDQSGAFAVLASHPLGRTLLALVALGLVAMAIWQALTAAVGYRNREGAMRVLERIGAAVRTVVYAGLAWSAGKIVFGRGSSSAAKQQKAASDVLSAPGGQLLVGLAGLAVLAVAIGLAAFGVSGKFRDNLHTERMSPSARRSATALGAVGYIGKGVAYGVVGVLLGWAALSYDPNKSRGLDAALRTLAGQPYGWLALGLVALGFAAFSGYCVVQAGYRKT